MFLVTGGAGFIGSHLVDALIASGKDVLVIDDLSAGKKEFVNPKAKLVVANITKDKLEDLFSGAECVYHFAADPLVKESAEKPRSSFDINVSGTFRVLEACRKSGVKQIVFASTSTVYGDAVVLPTPEEYPVAPISNYGASKLAGEAYLSSYCSTYGMKGTSLRYANIFGPRSTHGVLYDFFHKLRKNKVEMEILGDGNQGKSYLYVSDCVEASIFAAGHQTSQYDVFNVGSEDKVTTNTLAQWACEEVGVSPRFMRTGGKRGWVGDVPLMLLSIAKLKKLGWKPKVRMRDGVSSYFDWLKKQK